MSLNKKAFFSVAVLVFAFLLFMVYANYIKNSSDIIFDDSPRLFTLKIDEAYIAFDKNISYMYIDYKTNITKDCNVKLVDIAGYYNYMLGPTKLNEYCDVYGVLGTQTGMYTPIYNSIDVNYPFTIRCTYSDSIKRYTSNQQIVFHKKYQSYKLANGKCRFIVSDNDTQNQYFGIDK